MASQRTKFAPDSLGAEVLFVRAAPPVHGTAAGGAPYFLNGTCIMTRKKPLDQDGILAALRQFNEMGAAAVKNLTAQANALEERIARLEEFQKTLIAPGDRSKAS